MVFTKGNSTKALYKRGIIVEEVYVRAIRNDTKRIGH